MILITPFAVNNLLGSMAHMTTARNSVNYLSVQKKVNIVYTLPQYKIYEALRR